MMLNLSSTISQFPRRQRMVAAGCLLLACVIGAWLTLKSSPSSVKPRATSSVILSDEKLPAPSKVEKIPDDLNNPNLEYSGVYEDGWMSSISFFNLSQPEKANTLTLRGMVPGVNNNAFSEQLQVTIDRQFVGGQILGIGDFELTFPLPMGAGRRRVQLYFSGTQLLGRNDDRPVSALLKFIGLEEKANLDLKLPTDVTDRGIGLGSGWYLPEKSDKSIYRWADNNAEITVAMPDEDESQAIHLEIEPGPGLDSKPFELKVLNTSNDVVARHKVSGRETVRLSLPLKSGQSETFKLKVEGGGKLIPNDSRNLNFRVFSVKFGKHSPDVTRLGGGINLGTGWYDPEFGNGKAFRWVANNAEITATMPEDKSVPLSFDLEPGPGVDFKPFELQVLAADGKVVTKIPIGARETARVTLPTLPGKTESFKFYITGGGKQLPHESRILNYRVFSIGLGNLSGKDIVPPESFAGMKGHLEIGTGWYAPEIRDGQTYRWVNNNAELVVSMPQKGAPVLSLEIESGPGLDRKPFTLQIQNAAGLLMTQATVKEYSMVNIPLPMVPGQKETIRLHVDGGGKQIPKDNRVLNFRVFNVRLGKPITDTNRGLLQSGMYQDGWTTRTTTFQIPQLQSPATLTVRGIVPMLADKAFSTPVRVLVDSQEVTQKTLSPGDFDIQVAPPSGAGNRLIELRFGKTQILPGEDKRRVSALLKYVGFDAPAAPGPKTEPNAEIPLPTDSINLGGGWYPAETYQGSTFRWVNNNAELIVTPLAGSGHQLLSITLEPGPGVGSQPFELSLTDSEGKIIATSTVRGNEKIRLTIPTINTNKAIFKLFTKDGGKTIAGDLRILNFRVFKLEWAKP